MCKRIKRTIASSIDTSSRQCPEAGEAQQTSYTREAKSRLVLSATTQLRSDDGGYSLAEYREWCIESVAGSASSRIITRRRVEGIPARRRDSAERRTYIQQELS